MKHFWVKEKSRSCRPYKRQHGDVQEPQDHHSQQPTTLQHIACLQKCDLWWQQLSSPKLSSDSNCASVHFFEHLSIVILPRILPCSKRTFAPEDAVESRKSRNRMMAIHWNMLEHANPIQCMPASCLHYVLFKKNYNILQCWGTVEGLPASPCGSWFNDGPWWSNCSRLVQQALTIAGVHGFITRRVWHCQEPVGDLIPGGAGSIWDLQLMYIKTERCTKRHDNHDISVKRKTAVCTLEGTNQEKHTVWRYEVSELLSPKIR